MGNEPRAGGRYVVPVKTDGAEATAAGPRGRYTLAANTTYVAILGGSDAPFLSTTVTGYTSTLVLTSVTFQTTDQPSQEVPDTSTTAGEWLSETPTTAYVPVGGTGWSVGGTGIVAAGGTGVGGARFNLAESAAYRNRLLIVVGAAGGDIAIATHGKG